MVRGIKCIPRYNNTIRDLVGVDLRPADEFPEDDIGYGFDNIGDVLSVPPVLFERYLAAAEKVLDTAIVTAPPEPALRRIADKDLKGGNRTNRGGRLLASRGEVYTNLRLEEDGKYLLRVKAFGDQAGEYPARMAFRVDGKQVAIFDVRERSNAPADFEKQLDLSAGRRKLEVAFLNDYYRPDAPDPNDRDRNLHIVQLEVIGPLATTPPALPTSHRRIFIAEPAGAKAEDRWAAARQILGRFAERAFRRPVQAAELDRLLALYAAIESEGVGFEESVKVALQAVLVSPHFLFRGETRANSGRTRRIQPIDEFALATRLSYFLWSTMPDDELSGLAKRGLVRLNLESQVRRMLDDPRANALVENFAGQWLLLRKLDTMAPDKAEYPAFDESLRAAMRRETELFFERIMREDRSVLEFVDSDWTYANERLANHYGLEGVRGDAFRLVSLKGTPRGGLLTQASILTLTSNPTRTSPVKRGKWVLDNLLGMPPPPPPPNVPELEDTQAAKLTGTLRERMGQHQADPLCASCHARLDPIGFGFENFDGLGAWRDRDGKFAIDAAGKLVTGETFRGPAELKHILRTAKREKVVHCLASKMLTYALGRGLEYYDECALDEIGRALVRSEYRFSALVLAVVRSVPFQMQRSDTFGAERSP